jgi:hypothetical protein
VSKYAMVIGADVLAAAAADVTAAIALGQP